MSTTTTILGTFPDIVPLSVSTVSDAVAVLCVVPAIIGIHRGVLKLPPATWGIWAAASFVGAAGMAMAGAPIASWGLKLALGVGPLAVAVAGHRAGLSWITTRVDRVCLGLAAVGLVALLFGQGLVALVLAIAVNIVGTPPTVLHAWRAPWEESHFPFACAGLCVLAVGLFAIPVPWTFASVAYPIYLLVDVLIIMGTIAYARARSRARDTDQPGVTA